LNNHPYIFFPSSLAGSELERKKEEDHHFRHGQVLPYSERRVSEGSGEMQEEAQRTHR